MTMTSTEVRSEDPAPDAPATATAPAPAPAPAPATAAPPWWVNVATLGVILVATWAANVFIPPSATPGLTGTVEGLSAFALFYVFAQVIERFLEPIVSLERFTAAEQERRRDAAVSRARGLTDGGEKARALAKATAHQAHVDQWKASRALLVFAAATVIGTLVAAWLDLSFLTALGVRLEAAPRWLHLLVTGLLIGGGTKPLHDLLTRIQQKKSDAQTPSEVSAKA